AVGLHHHVELLRAVFLRPVEHHVLEEMRQAGRAGTLVARTDSVKDVKRHVRNRMILFDDDLHPVLERVGLDLQSLGRGDGEENDGCHQSQRDSCDRLHSLSSFISSDSCAYKSRSLINCRRTSRRSAAASLRKFTRTISAASSAIALINPRLLFTYKGN